MFAHEFSSLFILLADGVWCLGPLPFSSKNFYSISHNASLLRTNALSICLSNTKNISSPSFFLFQDSLVARKFLVENFGIAVSFFFFQQLNMCAKTFWLPFFFYRKFTMDYIFAPLYIALFSCFHNFSLFLPFSGSISMCLVEFFFLFILLGVCWASWIPMLMFSSNVVNFNYCSLKYFLNQQKI